MKKERTATICNNMQQYGFYSCILTVQVCTKIMVIYVFSHAI